MGTLATKGATDPQQASMGRQRLQAVWCSLWAHMDGPSNMAHWRCLLDEACWCGPHKLPLCLQMASFMCQLAVCVLPPHSLTQLGKQLHTRVLCICGTLPSCPPLTAMLVCMQ